MSTKPNAPIDGSLAPTSQPVDPMRRDLLRQGACVAAGFAAMQATVAAQTVRGAATSVMGLGSGSVQAFERSRLVTKQGRRFSASSLKPLEPHVFMWPYAVTPAFLLALDRPTDASVQTDERQTTYRAPAGVGRERRIVAFSAICAHKLVYPTAAVSFIGVRAGKGSEPKQVIHCCGDDTRYDPQQGARVLSGPAPQPLAAIELAWDAATDELHAVAMLGSHRFDEFFARYAIKLELEQGVKQLRALAGETTGVHPASEFSKQWQSCKVT